MVDMLQARTIDGVVEHRRNAALRRDRSSTPLSRGSGSESICLSERKDPAIPRRGSPTRRPSGAVAPGRGRGAANDECVRGEHAHQRVMFMKKRSRALRIGELMCSGLLMMLGVVRSVPVSPCRAGPELEPEPDRSRRRPSGQAEEARRFRTDRAAVARSTPLTTAAGRRGVERIEHDGGWSSA